MMFVLFLLTFLISLSSQSLSQAVTHIAPKHVTVLFLSLSLSLHVISMQTLDNSRMDILTAHALALGLHRSLKNVFPRQTEKVQIELVQVEGLC